MSATLDPLEEGSVENGLGVPVPVFTMGTRVPTGRDWTESSATLHEDVTGVEQPAVIGGAALERTIGKWPWRVGSTAEVGVGPTLQPVVVTGAGLGRYLGARWTLGGTLSHQIGWAAVDGSSHAAAQTNAGASMIHGAPGRWRGWVSALTSIPVAGVGRSSARKSSLSTGFAVVL